MTETLTRDFVDLLSSWSADDPELVARCQLLITDGVAVAVAGATERGPTLMAELMREDGTSGPATVIGQRFSAPVATAARVNGMAMHVLDFEPMWNPANHAMSPLLPALLALGEQQEAVSGEPQGRAVLRALAKGIEVQGRLRVSSRQFEPGRLQFHPPGIVGPIASAFGCATLLGLDAEATTAAIGIAASRTGGLLANVGSHTKALHCGDGAAHGLEAAQLAQRGFTANPDALGNPRGWGNAFFGSNFDTAALLAPIGRGRALVPGPAWKLFPSQFATHYAITAALDIRAQIAQFDAARIRRIELRAPVMPYIDRPAPDSGLAGKFSWQYTATIALLDGAVEPESFTDRRRHADDVNPMLGRFELTGDPSIVGDWENMFVEMTVHLDDGSVVATRCDAPIGSWRRPVAAAAVIAKATGLLETTLGKDRARAVLTASTQPVERFSVRELMATLR